jgi:hypothetical protein
VQRADKARLPSPSYDEGMESDEQGFESYANSRRAHFPGGTALGAQHARPSCYSRLSEEASALSAARDSEQ